MDIIDKTPERNTTQQELQQYPTVRERIQQLDTSNTFDSTDPNQRWVSLWGRTKSTNWNNIKYQAETGYMNA